LLQKYSILCKYYAHKFLPIMINWWYWLVHNYRVVMFWCIFCCFFLLFLFQVNFWYKLCNIFSIVQHILKLCFQCRNHFLVNSALLCSEFQPLPILQWLVLNVHFGCWLFVGCVLKMQFIYAFVWLFYFNCLVCYLFVFCLFDVAVILLLRLM
jgi:hypothetical protein